MNDSSHLRSVTIALLAICCLAASASGQILPTAEVLVPYFAMDLANPETGDVTLFAVCNHDHEATGVTLGVYSNWGIRVLESQKTLGPGEALTVNMRDWLIYGKLPDRQLGAAEIAHLQAALSGRPSPLDQRYYGTEIRRELAVGYVTARNASGRDCLWGDFFTMQQEARVFQADPLFNIDRSEAWNLPCKVHAVRFLQAGPYEDVGTHLVIWTPKQGVPSTQPTTPDWLRLRVTIEVYDEAGHEIEERVLALLPTQVLDLRQLSPPLPLDFGWLQVELETEGYVGVDFNATDALTAGLHSYCVPPEQPGPGPGVHLEKLVNGEDADFAPGPTVPVGSPLAWTYEVTNLGPEQLVGVEVNDSAGLTVSCPKSVLASGESMVCAASSAASECQQSNVGRVTATDTNGTAVEDEDLAFYFGEQAASVAILGITVNDTDARTPPGPGIAEGTPLAWAYQVKNTGEAVLTAVAVSDGALAVSCPKTTLQPYEAMTCTANDTARVGNQTHEVTAQGTTPCGRVVTAAEAAYYFGIGNVPRIDLQKLTNGNDADLPTGPQLPVGGAVTWTYILTNTGNVTLTAVTLTDDKRGPVGCPKTVLAAGEAMTCTAGGTASAGQYVNVATAVGTPPGGPTVSATDPSHYYGLLASIDVEKLVNGDDADTAPGPTIVAGTTIHWTYVVTNAGELPLVGVAVVDDQPVAVTCPKKALAVGESMTCTGTSLAVVGLHANVATASGHPEGGGAVSDTDPCYYTGMSVGGQGCSHGYWKNHVGSWAATGHSPNQTIGSVFANAGVYYPTLAAATMLEGLSFDGGSGGEGAASNLLKQAVAAVLNAAHPGVDFPRTPAEVIGAVDAALLLDRDAMLALAGELDVDNNLGCPLN